MKRLWKTVPPCLSDVLGFQDVMTHTDGLGVVDDSSNYKSLERGRGGKPGGRGGYGGGRPEQADPYRDEAKSGISGYGESRQGNGGWSGKKEGGWSGHGGYGGQNSGEGGWNGKKEGGWSGHGGYGGQGGQNGSEGGWSGKKGGGYGGGRGGRGDIRVVSSEIQEADVVNGTEGKMMEAFERGKERYQPTFAMLTLAPCSSMINTDLDGVAEKIESQYGIPAKAVALDGQKDYLYGVSCTLEAMGQLLLEKGETIPDSVNILGCNGIDFTESAIQEMETWLNDAGYQVLTKWGAQETAENLKKASCASVNLVVNISGLRLAQYMEKEYQIPYVVGAPFGREQSDKLLEQLKNGTPAEPEQEPEQEPEALIIAEQLTADAIRSALKAKGWKSVRVCSFYEMDKGLMKGGDHKLNGEDELSEELSQQTLKVVFGDVDYQLPEVKSLAWVAMPNNSRVGSSNLTQPFSMVGEALDQWLNEQLSAVSLQ